MKFKTLLVAVGIAISLSACAPSAQIDNEKKLTLGLVQQSIKQGISSVKVLETLGSPNIVRTAPGSTNEIWVYDKIYHTKSESALGLLLGGGGNGMGGAAGASNSTSVSSSKSLTVIIKFDKNDTIKDVSYFRSSF
jgi:outer membrane protein assembly factor BamE (lipoprotein component of BamABCDE complex)